MATVNDWAAIVASALNWEQAHASFDNAIKDLPAELRGKRAENFPHSVWELLDHIRATQHDLLEFCRNPKYYEPKWPDDYWPKSPAPADAATWDRCIKSFHEENAA